MFPVQMWGWYSYYFISAHLNGAKQEMLLTLSGRRLCGPEFSQPLVMDNPPSMHTHKPVAKGRVRSNFSVNSSSASRDHYSHFLTQDSKDKSNELSTERRAGGLWRLQPICGRGSEKIGGWERLNLFVTADSDDSRKRGEKRRNGAKLEIVEQDN